MPGTFFFAFGEEMHRILVGKIAQLSMPMVETLWTPGLERGSTPGWIY